MNNEAGIITACAINFDEHRLPTRFKSGSY